MSTLEYRSAADEPGDQRWWSWLGWAVYLGMSWTWCIGMFLPVLLVRDYGLWGWVVFAIPNVIGAAAVGWINRTAEQSRQTTEAHRHAIAAFSVATATFQIFFGAWLIPVMLSGLSRETQMIDVACLAVWVLLVLFGAGRSFAVAWLGGCVVCICMMFASRQIPPPQALLYVPAVLITKGMPSGLIPLSVSTCFGFLTCPHLDITFHRARVEMSPIGARVAFGLGLGVIFAAMITFALFYSGIALKMLSHASDVPNIFIIGFCMYLAIQLTFTIREHLLLVATTFRPRRFTSIYLFVVCAILGCFAAGLARVTHYESLFGGEFGYRLFLAWYGLIFPAYVWICMLPGNWVQPPTKRQWIVFAIAVVAALPAFWMAFIERQMQWVLLGVGLPLAARLFVRSPVQQ